MKRAILIIFLVAAAVGGGIFYMKKGAGEAKPAAAPPEEEAKITVTHDAAGNTVINIDDEAQGNIGITVAHPTAAQEAPELKSYGRVLDPAPLVALVNELAADQAAYAASSQELERTKTLLSQGNSSARALQAAEAAALHDQLLVQSVKDRLILGWGREIAERQDLAAFAQTLLAFEAALVRLDLPGGERIASKPAGARLATLAGLAAKGQFLGEALNVDPQMQGQGFLFKVQPNQPPLRPGEAVTGYLTLPGDALAGVIIPREAVVRTEGAGWIYVLNPSGAAFTRTQIALDHPTDAGWFVTQGAAAADDVVVTGAQTLLSQETKAALKPD